jgi:hypothetical protein
MVALLESGGGEEQIGNGEPLNKKEMMVVKKSVWRRDSCHFQTSRVGRRQYVTRVRWRTTQYKGGEE